MFPCLYSGPKMPVGLVKQFKDCPSIIIPGVLLETNNNRSSDNGKSYWIQTDERLRRNSFITIEESFSDINRGDVSGTKNQYERTVLSKDISEMFSVGLEAGWRLDLWRPFLSNASLDCQSYISIRWRTTPLPGPSIDFCHRHKHSLSVTSMRLLSSARK
jgi:hypothetical protein